MYQKIKFLFLFLLFIQTIVLSNDGNFSSKIELNTSSIDAWFKKNNNFGLQKENILLEANYRKKINDKIKLSLNILISPDNLYYKDSFLSYNFTDTSYFKIGKYYRDYSKYLNDSLSSGHLLVSNNAQPLNRIGFNSSKKVRDVRFDFGISHATLEKNENDGRQGESFNDFLKILIAADGPLREGDPHANALGNHLGLWEFVYEKKLQSNTIKIYYQHLFEDTSGLRFANRYDGLWGIMINNKNNTYLLEYLETTNQNINPPYVDDAYYNHWLYDYGWSHQGFSIGNPHINPFEVVPINVIHLGTSLNYNNKSLIFRLSKKTNINSQINGIITLEYGKKNMLAFSLYNDGNKFGLSFGCQILL